MYPIRKCKCGDEHECPRLDPRENGKQRWVGVGRLCNECGELLPKHLTNCSAARKISEPAREAIRATREPEVVRKVEKLVKVAERAVSVPTRMLPARPEFKCPRHPRKPEPGCPYCDCREESMSIADEQEREANLFAMELLMPRKFLLKDLRALGSIDMCDDSNIRKLARKYGVGEQLMTLRIATILKGGL